MNVVGYYRYSSDNKNQVENSEAKQSEYVERNIYRNKWTLVDTFVDEAKSGNDDKPELMRLKELYEAGEISFDCLCIDELSRITRRNLYETYKDIGWIEENNLKLSILDKNHGKPVRVSELGRDLNAIFTQWQNHEYLQKISRDVRNGMATKFQRGIMGWSAPAPYGYDLVRQVNETTKLKTNEDIKVVREIFDHVLNGGSINSCVQILQRASKFRNDPTKSPNRSSVLNVLRNSIYCGIRCIGVRSTGKFNTIADHKHKHITQNPLVQCKYSIDYEADTFKPCVTVDEYNRVQDMLDGNLAGNKKFPRRGNHPYSGRLRCLDCGTPLNASIYRDSVNGDQIRYVCPRSYDQGKKCKDGIAPKRKQVRTDELDAMISRKLVALIMSSSFHANTIELLCQKITKQSTIDAEGLKNDYIIQKRRLDELTEFALENDLSALKDRLREQNKIVEKARLKADEVSVSDEYLEFAKAQFENEGKGGMSSLLSVYYQFAVFICNRRVGRSRRKTIETLAKGITRRIQNNIIDIVDRVAGENVELGADMINNLHMVFDQRTTLAVLDSLALDHIRVGFSLGLWRGKRRRVPANVEFVFSLAAKNCTDIRVVANGNRLEFAG